MEKKIEKLLKEIAEVKMELSEIGSFRPGNLTRQYHDPARKRGGYFQLSYTYRMKSKSEYVRPSSYSRIKKETMAYRKFRKLVSRWLELEIELSKTRAAIEKQI